MYVCGVEQSLWAKDKQFITCRAEVVTQLAGRLLPIPAVSGWNPVIGKINVSTINC